MERTIRIIIIYAALFLAAPAFSQNLCFKLSRGKETQKVSYIVTPYPNGSRVRIVIGSMDTTQILDSEYRTKEWRYTDSSKHTDVRIVLRDGVYHVSGVLNGKRIDRYVKTQGYAWRQNFAYACGHVLSGGCKGTYYECFLPRDMQLHAMQGTLMGRMEWAGNQVMRVKANPTGALAKLWSCDYYYDVNTLNLAGYKAVEGGPGTPVTTWVPAK